MWETDLISWSLSYEWLGRNDFGDADIKTPSGQFSLWESEKLIGFGMC